MSFAETVVLGAIAGSTIYLGLPLGRIGRVNDQLRVALAMFSVGVLAFIFMDVTKHAQQIVNLSLASFKDHRASFGHVLGLFSLLALCFTAGTAGIASVERRLRSRGPLRIAGGAGAGNLSAGPRAADDVEAADARRLALKTGMTIAIAIGLHNFAEGLAIGVSAKTGAVGLATVLIVGFGLHNATEGFGIVGPLGGVRPSWKWLGVAGLVGGGPTFLGTIAGYQVHSDALELCFYGLAGGAILYVVGELQHVGRKIGSHEAAMAGLLAGLLLALGTDLLLKAAGA